MRKRTQRAADGPVEHAPDVDIDRADATAEGQGRHGPRGVRPDPGQSFEGFEVIRNVPVVIPDDRDGSLSQGDGPPVVAETSPRPKDRGRRRRREGLDGRKLDHEAGPVLGRPGCLGLLGHRFRHEDGVGVGRATEREVAAALRVPREDGGPEGGRCGEPSPSS